MIKIEIPDFRLINAEHLVLDFNGTIAVDGRLIEGVAGKLSRLSANLTVHVLTADTFNTAQNELKGLPVILRVLEAEGQDRQKSEYVRGLGADKVISIGNGRNDILMLKDSAIGIAVIQGEGAYSQIINFAHICCTSINDALSLIVHPKRLLATLRN